MTLLEAVAEAFREALGLIIAGDQMVFDIALRSLYVSGLAILLASIWSLPMSMLLGLASFPGRRLIRGTFNALIGIPTVSLGLILYLVFSRSGPLGFLQLLYNPMGITIGQAILITPIVVSFSTNAFESLDPELKDLACTLGASRSQTFLTMTREALWAVILAVVAGFNRAFSELGIAMMVGGNIPYVTRVLTTAIALETARGEVAFSLALAMVLLAIVYSLSLTMSLLRRE